MRGDWLGTPPRYRIVLELEPVEAHRHDEARAAADQVAAAIEQLACTNPDLEDMQLVEVKRLVVERIPEEPVRQVRG